MFEEGGIPQIRNNNPFQECVLLRALTSVKLDLLIDEGWHLLCTILVPWAFMLYGGYYDSYLPLKCKVPPLIGENIPLYKGASKYITKFQGRFYEKGRTKQH